MRRKRTRQRFPIYNYPYESVMLLLILLKRIGIYDKSLSPSQIDDPIIALNFSIRNKKMKEERYEKNTLDVTEDLFAALISLGLSSPVSTLEGNIFVTLNFAGRMNRLIGDLLNPNKDTYE